MAVFESMTASNQLKQNVVFILVLCALSCAQAEDQQELFESRIRPVLVDQCYECHNSHDVAEAGLALDFREPFAQDRDLGRLIVPGQPDRSRLLAIIRHEIPGLEMPDGRPKLSEKTILDFEKWIRLGAFDPREKPPSRSELKSETSWEAVMERRKQWWCFQPITKSSPPEIGSPDSSNWLAKSDHPIDRFVAAKQRSAGLSASEPAESNVLVRRLFFALIGLPPTDAQARYWVEQFKSNREDAVEQIVDKLLASEHFGERWARHWMDWIRYADSHGSEGDPKIENAWMYRDYLIRALNQDVPFDQVLREHIAGDLIRPPRMHIENATNESIIGTAHWRMVFHGFAPTDALDEKVRFIDDQVNAFSKAFLGLTVSCARCHDHKFDAISQEDYYALFGILSACRPARHAINLLEHSKSIRQELRDLKPDIRSAIADDWLNQSDQLGQAILKKFTALDKSKPLSRESIFFPLRAILDAIDQHKPIKKAWPVAKSSAEEMLLWDPKGNDQAFKWRFAGRGLENTATSGGQFAVDSNPSLSITGIYPTGIYSHSISNRDDARLTSLDFPIDAPAEIWMQTIGQGNSSARYVVHDYPRKGTVYPVHDNQPTWKWQKFDLSYWQGDQVHLELATARDAPLLVRPDKRSWFGIRSILKIPKGSKPPGESNQLLWPILKQSVTPDSIDEAVLLYQSAIVQAIESWNDGTVDDAQALLLDACLQAGILPRGDEKLPTAKVLLSRYRRLESQLPTLIRVPGIESIPNRQQRLYTRGNHKTPSQIVPPRFLSAMGSESYAASTSRLQLADDVLRQNNPLTRRVIVNRLWHHLFGKGIVSTPDNFGKLGAMPTHPELLDWMANLFANSGGSIKSMIRMIVTSNTWQLSSRPSTKASQIDPENRLLTHANVRRLEAEAIRDSMLTVSGTLQRTIGGPTASGNSPRRSIYLPVIRNSLDPFLRAFDFPEPFSTVGRRESTNVPAQSLTLLNDPVVTQIGKQWARQYRGQTIMNVVDSLFWSAFCRPPSGLERQRIMGYLALKEKHQTTQDSELRSNKIKLDIDQDTPPLEELTRSLFLFKEFIYLR